jgi:hypothetical protein
MEVKIAKCSKRGRRRIIGVSDVTCVRVIEVVLYVYDGKLIDSKFDFSYY